MVEIRVPRFDVNEETAKVARVYVDNLTYVKKDSPLFELETVKTVELICSPTDGYVLVLVEEGTIQKFGTLLAVIDESKEALLYFANSQQQSNSNSSVQPKDSGFAKKSTVSYTETPVSSDSAEVMYTSSALTLINQIGINRSSLDAYFSLNGKKLVTKDDILSFWEEMYKKIAEKRLRFKYDVERIAIIGAGNGAQVVLDILLDYTDKVAVVVVDDNKDSFEFFGLSLPVFRGIERFPSSFDKHAYDTVIISIGANLKTMTLRHKIFEEYKKCGIKFTNVISRTAEIRRGVRIGDGNIIGAGVYVGTLTEIGHNNSISYGAKIGHHNKIGNSNLIGPGVVTSGSVQIGHQCIISAGVSFINRVRVGNKVILPVGFNVTQDIPDDTTVKY